MMLSSKPHTRGTRPNRHEMTGRPGALAFALLVATVGMADVRISSDWASGLGPNGHQIPDSLSESVRILEATRLSAIKRNATPPGPRGEPEYAFGYKLFLDNKKHYLMPVLFMAKQRPDEVCNPVSFKNEPIYKCEEGQHYALGCHIFIFDSTFREVGFHTVKIAEPWPLFCNAVTAVGTGDKKNNELLLTVQYFPVDRKAASKISEIGSGWNRMTVLLRVKADNGKVIIDQDDRCLGNPNRIETIPDARRRLKKCKEK